VTAIGLALVLLGSASAAFGQSGQLSGRIRDPSALGVSGTEITVRNEQTSGKRLTRSNDPGSYTVFSFSPGIYRVSVRADGFESMIREGLELDVDENALLDFGLRIGDSRTEITVHGGPVGALGRRLIGSASLPNPAPYYSVDVLGNNASLSYHAMQLQFNRRLSIRMRLLLSYSWSHSIDNLSNDLNSIVLRGLTVYLDPSINRGPSDFDIRHSLNGSFIAALPSPHSALAAILFHN
jgi:hypothetical protein